MLFCIPCSLIFVSASKPPPERCLIFGLKLHRKRILSLLNILIYHSPIFISFRGEQELVLRSFFLRNNRQFFATASLSHYFNREANSALSLSISLICLKSIIKEPLLSNKLIKFFKVLSFPIKRGMIKATVFFLSNPVHRFI